MNTELTYYDLLGVSREASFEEIKEARQRYVKALHPDRHDEAIREPMNEQLARVNNAADVLLDEESRREYDARLEQGSVSEEDVYRAEDLWDFYEAYAEEKGEDVPEEASPPSWFPDKLYAVLMDPPGLPDKLAIYVAWGMIYLLVGAAPALVPGATTSIAIALWGLLWIFAIPAVAFILSSRWMWSYFAPVRWAMNLFSSALFMNLRFLSPRLASMFAPRFGGTRADSFIQSGLRQVERFKLVVAVLKALWRGPLVFFVMVLVAGLIPPLTVILGPIWLAALLWCTGRVFVVMWNRRQLRAQEVADA